MIRKRLHRLLMDLVPGGTRRNLTANRDRGPHQDRGRPGQHQPAGAVRSVAGASRQVLGEVGDIGRFPTKHHFAAHTGTAPLAASSGQVVRHRLSRAGDRRLNTPCT